ncbi:adhesion G protein-coupled receptor E5-like [Emys orbicularis]|uniref:adhesion G protein-coupled receptor E5-like n=1 Tax=Emys orbicularis TaxID=82168 RepID=UPI0031FC66C2
MSTEGPSYLSAQVQPSELGLTIQSEDAGSGGEFGSSAGLCIALCLGGTVAQNHGVQGTTEDCNSHMLCPANAKCVNNTHCACLDGYGPKENHTVFFTDPTEICDDINECLGPSKPDCGPHANCANVAGSYYCTCTDGYEPSSEKANFTHASENTCQDIDECQGHANCTKVAGNYSCSCLHGYELSSGKANFMHTNGDTCQDIDECQQNTTICEPHGNCINMPGSYMCKCSWGFGKSQKDPSKICTDIDECRKTRDICSPNATCVNTYGSYWCKCRAGYVPSNGNTTLCQDMDECRKTPGICSPNATCINTYGSYWCKCRAGYVPSNGNTTLCQDIDECRKTPDICGPNATCINTYGSYWCKCRAGYVPSKGNTTLCQDIDECKKTPDICGPNATCTNTNGSYQCECRAGYIRFNGSTTLCKELTCPRLLDDDNSAGAKNLQGSFQAQVGRLCKAALEELKQMNSQNAEGKLQGFLDILEKQINLVGQQSESVERRHRIATELMAIVEKLLRTLTMTLPDSMISIASTNGTELGLAVRQAGNQSQETVTLQQSKTQMELKSAGAPGQKEGFTLAGLLTYQGMSPILDGAGRVEMPKWDKIGQTGKWAQKPGRPSYRVLSPVVSAFISDPNPQALGLSVSIRFSHPVPESKTNLCLLCAYWEPGSRRWATHGCTLQKLNATITRCQCNHLTSFAVLMAFYELEDWTLDVITKVGLVISLLCLLLSIVTFLFCRALKGPRTTIHLHLCLALFIAYTVFLTGTSSTGNRVVCGVVAGLLHYFFLAAFCWMCLEGAELYLLVVQVFTPHGLRRRYMFLLGYGVPALIVGVSAATYSEGYGTAR